MNKKNLLLIMAFACFSLLVYAQDETSTVNGSENNSNIGVKSIDQNKTAKKNAFQLNPNSLGFYACYPVTGGFSYHRWIDKFGIQITGGGIALNNMYTDYNIQVAFQGMVFGKDIASWFATAFYPFGIIGHRGEGSGGYAPNDTMEFDFSYYLGGGIGLELLFVKHLSFTLELSLVGSYPWELTMGGGGSIRFRF